MAKETIGIRLDTEWLINFKKRYPRANLSKICRELVYKFYPLDNINSATHQYRLRIVKNNELMNKLKQLQEELENNEAEMKLYESKIKESDSNV